MPFRKREYPYPRYNQTIYTKYWNHCPGTVFRYNSEQWSWENLHYKPISFTLPHFTYYDIYNDYQHLRNAQTKSERHQPKNIVDFINPTKLSFYRHYTQWRDYEENFPRVRPSSFPAAWNPHRMATLNDTYPYCELFSGPYGLDLHIAYTHAYFLDNDVSMPMNQIFSKVTNTLICQLMIRVINEKSDAYIKELVRQKHEFHLNRLTQLNTGLTGDRVCYSQEFDMCGQLYATGKSFLDLAHSLPFESSIFFHNSVLQMIQRKKSMIRRLLLRNSFKRSCKSQVCKAHPPTSPNIWLALGREPNRAVPFTRTTATLNWKDNTNVCVDCEKWGVCKTCDRCYHCEVKPLLPNSTFFDLSMLAEHVHPEIGQTPSEFVPRTSTNREPYVVNNLKNAKKLKEVFKVIPLTLKDLSALRLRRSICIGLEKAYISIYDVLDALTPHVPLRLGTHEIVEFGPPTEEICRLVAYFVTNETDINPFDLNFDQFFGIEIEEKRDRKEALLSTDSYTPLSDISRYAWHDRNPKQFQDFARYLAMPQASKKVLNVFWPPAIADLVLRERYVIKERHPHLSTKTLTTFTDRIRDYNREIENLSPWMRQFTNPPRDSSNWRVLYRTPYGPVKPCTSPSKDSNDMAIPQNRRRLKTDLDERIFTSSWEGPNSAPSRDPNYNPRLGPCGFDCSCESDLHSDSSTEIDKVSSIDSLTYQDVCQPDEGFKMVDISAHLNSNQSLDNSDSDNITGLLSNNLNHPPFLEAHSYLSVSDLADNNMFFADSLAPYLKLETSQNDEEVESLLSSFPSLPPLGDPASNPTLLSPCLPAHESPSYLNISPSPSPSPLPRPSRPSSPPPPLLPPPSTFLDSLPFCLPGPSGISGSQSPPSNPESMNRQNKKKRRRKNATATCDKEWEQKKKKCHCPRCKKWPDVSSESDSD